MTIINMVERAHTCLSTTFGGRWKAPYAEGKARMADRVWQGLQVPHEAAVQLIEALEAEGRIHFVGELGIETSPPSNSPGQAPPPDPLTPHTNTEGVRPDAIPQHPVLGDWIIKSMEP
jgi:hypothetical protein